MSDKYSQKWVSYLFRKDVWAITIGQTAYYSVKESDVSASWHNHENKHKEQYSRDGFIKFIFKYIFFQLKFGYNNNPYEVEARQAE